MRLHVPSPGKRSPSTAEITSSIEREQWAPLSTLFRADDLSFVGLEVLWPKVLWPKDLWPRVLWPRDLRARGDPLPVGLELQAELVVMHSQVPVSAAHNRFRYDILNFLRQYTDIDPVGTIVGKPIEPKAVVEATEKNDIVFERNIG